MFRFLVTFFRLSYLEMLKFVFCEDLTSKCIKNNFLKETSKPPWSLQLRQITLVVWDISYVFISFMFGNIEFDDKIADGDNFFHKQTSVHRDMFS
jgi:hypothetical protein